MKHRMVTIFSLMVSSFLTVSTSLTNAWGDDFQDQEFKLQQRMLQNSFKNQLQMQPLQQPSTGIYISSPSAGLSNMSSTFNAVSDIRSQIQTWELNTRITTNNGFVSRLSNLVTPQTPTNQMLSNTFSYTNQPSMASVPLGTNNLAKINNFVGGINRNEMFTSALPTNREISQWANELRIGARNDTINWARDSLISSVDQAFITPNLPQWVTRVRTWYDRAQSAYGWASWAQSLQSTPTGPSDALDRLKPIASLGGPASGPLMPVLKGYYAMVFDNLSQLGSYLSPQTSIMSNPQSNWGRQQGSWNSGFSQPKWNNLLSHSTNTFSASPVVVGYTNPITNRNETMVLSQQTFDAMNKWSQQQSVAQQQFNSSIINSTGQQQLNQWINSPALQKQWFAPQQTSPFTNFNINQNFGLNNISYPQINWNNRFPQTNWNNTISQQRWNDYTSQNRQFK
ncbi:MAG: hypothetical protein ABSB91_05665 [Sedimentisphaerales bacterium]